MEGSRRQRWLTALQTLDADPNFHDAGLLDLVDDEFEELDTDEIVDAAVGLFERMSSGHSIVLLTITKLVEKVEERTLLLIDEPEAHLHPPLLSAFVRALSDLIIDRNGVAVVATHSPVVLQEVPSSCVWKIERWGHESHASRPDIETFGENVGTLTREVFGLEVTNTGFNKLVQDEAIKASSYRQASQAFDHQLGSEAMGLLRTYLAIERDDESEQ